MKIFDITKWKTEGIMELDVDLYKDEKGYERYWIGLDRRRMGIHGFRTREEAVSYANYKKSLEINRLNKEIGMLKRMEIK